jgi:hypothetical protein
MFYRLYLLSTLTMKVTIEVWHMGITVPPHLIAKTTELALRPLTLPCFAWALSGCCAALTRILPSPLQGEGNKE